MQQQSQIGIGPLKGFGCNKGRCSGQGDAAHARGAVSATFPCGRNAVGQAVTNRHGPTGAR